MVGQKTAAEVATDDVETATARFAYETRWAGQQGTAREKCDGFATATLPVRGMARGGSKPTPACECPRQQAAAHTQADATDGSCGDGKHAARPNYLLLAGRKITRSVWHDRVQLNPEIEHGRVWAQDRGAAKALAFFRGLKLFFFGVGSCHCAGWSGVGRPKYPPKGSF